MTHLGRRFGLLPVTHRFTTPFAFDDEDESEDHHHRRPGEAFDTPAAVVIDSSRYEEMSLGTHTYRVGGFAGDLRHTPVGPRGGG